jgi:hypothetical protein
MLKPLGRARVPWRFPSTNASHASSTGYVGMTPVLDQLATEVAHLIRRELGAHGVHQVWTEDHRIRVRLGNGRTGDVEVLFNWDVVVNTKDEQGASPPTAV